MDGPLYIVVKKLDKKLCRLECFDEGTGGDREFSGEYSITDIIRAVLDVAKTAVSVCSKNGWDTDDVQGLKVTIKRVAGYLES